MDITSPNRMCNKHPQYKIEFLQVKDAQTQQTNNLFYCALCIDQDISFNPIDYIVMQKIIDEGTNQIIQKWPPVNNSSIIDQLIQLTGNSNQELSIEQKINSYFTTLKDEIFKKIDICQKKMINHAQELPLENTQILKKYQQISKIFELRQILTQTQSDIAHKELSYKQFILQMQSQKANITQQLENLLNQSLQQQQLIDFEYPNSIKQSILTFIDQIDFFNIISDKIKVANQEQKINSKIRPSDKIIELVSNKSNFCSNQFLDQLKQQLEKINPLLEQVQFQNQFQFNKQPINFNELDIQELEMIEKQANHFTKIKNNRDYVDEIKNSYQIQQVNRFLNNKFNFLSSKFREKFEKYLIETHPFLNQLNFENMILKMEEFQCFEDLSDDTITDLLSLTLKIKNQDDEDNNQYQTFLKKLTPLVYEQFFYIKKEDLDNILIKYPIFKLLQLPDIIDILPNIQLIKGNLKNGQQYLQINKNDNSQIQVYSSQQGGWLNCIGNISLEKDKKYIFRFQILQQDQGQFFMVGLMQESNLHTNYGYSDYLSFFGLIDQNKIKRYNEDYGISKQLKGDGFLVQQNEMIELRVSINEQVLEVLDYPNYNYKLGISDQYKQNLINKQDLKLYIGQTWQNLKISINNALIVTQFDN